VLGVLRAGSYEHFYLNVDISQYLVILEGFSTWCLEGRAVLCTWLLEGPSAWSLKGFSAWCLEGFSTWSFEGFSPCCLEGRQLCALGYSKAGIFSVLGYLQASGSGLVRVSGHLVS